MSKEKKFITCDGNQAASNIAYLFSENAAIYPITPSSTMAENVDEWSAAGKKNLWGETVKVTELPVPFTVLCRQVLSPAHSPHRKVCC